MKIKIIAISLFFVFSNKIFLMAADFNVVNFGAVNDTSVISTEAINKAVGQCYASGGGRVFVPAGNYKSGTIVLKDNVELHLGPGATLFASYSHDDFPRQKQPEYRSQKDIGGWYALIYAEGAQNISITGRGVIDGQGANQTQRLEELTGDRDGRPRNILFISCMNILVEGITMRNSGLWNQHYLNCEDVLVDHVNVYNHSNRNNDGIDIDGCRRFILSNSIIDSDDDGIVMKSTGTSVCEHVTITNCIVSSRCNAIKCGTESTGGFKNIVISNCIVKPTRNTIRPKLGIREGKEELTGLALEIVDGGIMEGVSVNNLVVEGMNCPIFVRLGNRARKHIEEASEPPVGIMRNIRISHVTAFNSGNFSSSITGIPGGIIESIYMDNIRIVNQGGLQSGEYIVKTAEVKENEKGYPRPNVWGNLPSSGLFVRHVKNISLSSISFHSDKTDPRPAIVAADVDNLTMVDIITDEATKKTILLEAVKKVSFDHKLKSQVIKK